MEEFGGSTSGGRMGWISGLKSAGGGSFDCAKAGVTASRAALMSVAVRSMVPSEDRATLSTIRATHNALLAVSRPVALQHLGEAGVERGLDLGIFLEPRHQHGGGLERGEPVAARLAAQLAVARRPLAREQHAAAFQHPRIAPPHRLGLAPGAVEQDDALDPAQRSVLIGQG